MPDILFGSALVIYYPQGEGFVEYDPVYVDGVGYVVEFGFANIDLPDVNVDGSGARASFGLSDIEYDPVTADGSGFRVAFGDGYLEYASAYVSGGARIHFSTGFVAECRPQTPTVCLDAVSIVEWKSNALWKRASDKCKPTP